MDKPKTTSGNLLEIDQWMSPQGSTLKSLFDNIRNYPLLAALVYVARTLNQEPGFLSQFSGLVVSVYVSCLALLTIVQTAVLMTSFFVWIMFERWRQENPFPKAQPETTSAYPIKKVVQWLLFMIFVLAIFIACIVTAGHLIHIFTTLKGIVR
jgi:hypothetical protein